MSEIEIEFWQNWYNENRGHYPEGLFYFMYIETEVDNYGCSCCGDTSVETYVKGYASPSAETHDQIASKDDRRYVVIEVVDVEDLISEALNFKRD